MNPFSVFSAKGNWFRGNCHTHSLLSDGDSSPKALAEAYRNGGYDFLVLTDHGKTHDDLSMLQRKDFLVISGVELHPPTRLPSVVRHHIVGIGVEKAPPCRIRKNGSARSTIKWIERNGGIAVYAHPCWSGHDIEHMGEGKSAFGVEVFNTATEKMRDLGDSSSHLDQALHRGIHWRAFAVDDLHQMARDFSGGWIMVKAAKLTRAAIMNAIRKGYFYASTGPEIKSLKIKRGVARITCSPVRKIVWLPRGPWGERIVSRVGKPLTTAEFSAKRFRNPGDYLRVEITDAKGRKAWTNPIWWDGKTGRWKD